MDLRVTLERLRGPEKSFELMYIAAGTDRYFYCSNV